MRSDNKHILIRMLRQEGREGAIYYEFNIIVDNYCSASMIQMKNRHIISLFSQHDGKTSLKTFWRTRKIQLGFSQRKNYQKQYNCSDIIKLCCFSKKKKIGTKKILCFVFCVLFFYSFFNRAKT